MTPTRPSPEAFRKICEWLTENGKDLQKISPPVVSLVLGHYRDDMTLGDTLTVVDMPDKLTGKAVEEVGSKLAVTATSDAHEAGGVQRYVVFPRLIDGGKGPGRLLFRVAAEGSSGSRGEDLGNEGPNSRGLTAQAMRHQEICMKLAMGASTEVVRSLENALMREQEKSNKYFDKYMEIVELKEKLLSQSQTRLLEARNSDFEIEAKHEILRRIGPLIPMVIGKMASKLLPGMGSVAGAMSIQDITKRLFDSLTKEQMVAIGTILTDQQKTDLYAIFQAAEGPTKSDAASAVSQVKAQGAVTETNGVHA